MSRSILLLAMLALGACTRPDVFQCASTAQCDTGKTCEVTGYCSEPNPDCPSGRRYGAEAGNMAFMCVDGSAPGAADASGRPDGPQDMATANLCVPGPAAKSEGCAADVCVVDASCCLDAWTARCAQLAQVACKGPRDIDCSNKVAVVAHDDSGTRVFVGDGWPAKDFQGLRQIDQVDDKAGGTTAWGDVNRDGQPDLAVCLPGFAPQVQRLLIADGAGYRGQDLGAPIQCVDVQWVDWDADGDADLAMLAPDGVYIADVTGGAIGKLQLRLSLPFHQGANRDRMDWANVQDTAAPEVAIGRGPSLGVAIYRREGSSLATWEALPAAAARGWSVAWGVFADGAVGLVTGSYGFDEHVACIDHDVSVWRRVGANHWSPQVLDTTVCPDDVEVAYLGGAAYPSIVSASALDASGDPTLRVSRNDHGTLATGVPLVGFHGGQAHLEVADIDEDEDLDVLTITGGALVATNAGGFGEATYDEHTIPSPVGTPMITSVDVTGDGAPPR